MDEWLGHAPEQEAETHAGTEQHRQPRPPAELRPLLGGTEPGTAHREDGQGEHEQHQAGDHDCVARAHAVEDEVLHGLEAALQTLGHGDADDHEGDREDERDVEDRAETRLAARLDRAPDPDSHRG